MMAVTEGRPVPLAGRTELGSISIADRVVTKIAARAAAENPDAGAAAARVCQPKLRSESWRGEGGNATNRPAEIVRNLSEFCDRQQCR